MLVLAIILVVLVFLAALGGALFYYGICRHPGESEPPISGKLASYSGQMQAGREWFLAQKTQTVSIKAFDSTPLVGHYLQHPEAKGTIILVHGFRSSYLRDFSCIFEFYYGLGYSLLAIEQRGQGASGGRYMTFGVKERFDCRDWARYLCDRFGEEHDIFFSGISMGATSVMMAAGLQLPESVRGIVADCGFTSPYEEFSEVLKYRHMPLHPIIDIVGLYTRAFAGFDLRECSTVEALRRTRIPVLFVHGEDDTFVPPRFSRANFAACASEKELVLIPGASHGGSYLVASERCQTALRAFFEQNASN